MTNRKSLYNIYRLHMIELHAIKQQRNSALKKDMNSVFWGEIRFLLTHLKEKQLVFYLCFPHGLIQSELHIFIFPPGNQALWNQARPNDGRVEMHQPHCSGTGPTTQTLLCGQMMWKHGFICFCRCVLMQMLQMKEKWVLQKNILYRRRATQVWILCYDKYKYV